MSRSSNPTRILYVSTVWPHKGAFGGELRCLNVLRALQAMGTVEVVLLNDATNTHSVPEPDSEFTVAYALDVKERPNERLIEKIRWMLDPSSDYPNGCGVGTSAMQRVLRSLNEFDVIWFFQLRSADAFPNAAWQRAVVDIDNVPSMYERATLQMAGGPRDRILALRRLLSWRRREKLLGDRFNVLTVCSEEDRQYLSQVHVKAPVHVIPNGFDRPSTEPVRTPVIPPRIGFIGLFEYFPNREGIHWFVNKCWPRIKGAVPGARLRLVGRDSDGPFMPRGPDVDGLGWLPNPSDEIKTWSVMVVPIRVGAGTRIKIAQGFSQKCPIVSTSVGAYGYGAVDGRQMFLADSAEAFSSACIRAIREPEAATQMAGRGWSEFLEKWTWDAIRPLVWAAAEDCMRSIANQHADMDGCSKRV